MRTWTVEEVEEHRRLYLAALRSGEYKQGFASLAVGMRYCCLGIACEVALVNGAPLRRVQLGDGPVKYTSPLLFPGRLMGEADESETLLPVAVRRWLGIDEWQANPDLAATQVTGTRTATNFNDVQRLTLGDIADLFEAYFSKRPPITDYSGSGWVEPPAVGDGAS